MTVIKKTRNHLMAVSRTLESAQATGTLARLRLDDYLSRKMRALLPDKRKFLDIMPKVGLEPTIPSGNTSLSRARLPVPPLRPAPEFYHN
jgi:hypothetical protein